MVRRTWIQEGVQVLGSERLGVAELDSELIPKLQLNF
jgi:hypothetical protein